MRLVPSSTVQFGICGLSYKEKTQRICGESGAQEFRAGGELRHSHLHDRVVTAANHVFLDLSFGVCCHSSKKTRQSRVILAHGIHYNKNNMYRNYQEKFGP